jgi:hypothetical protein
VGYCLFNYTLFAMLKVHRETWGSSGDLSGEYKWIMYITAGLALDGDAPEV